MFRDRAFMVKVVKDPDVILSGDTEPVDVDELGQTVAKYAILVIAAYMGADVVRQIAIHSAKIMIEVS